MGKMLKKPDINLLGNYWRSQNRLVRKHWLINSSVWFSVLVLAGLFIYFQELKPKQTQLQFSQKQTAILQKQLSEFDNANAVAMIPATAPTGLVTIQYQNADVRDVLQQIAASGDMSLLFSEHIQGTITLFLESLPWRDALDVVLELSDLIAEERENVLLIWTEGEVIERAQKELMRNP